MNIFEALLKSHAKLRDLCDKIVKTKGDTNKRRQLYQALVSELRAYAQASERYFYAPLMFDDVGLYIARHALFEHHQTDILLSDLDLLDYSHSQWLVKVKQLVEKFFLYLNDLETIVFHQAQTILTPVQQHKLADYYTQEYEYAQI